MELDTHVIESVWDLISQFVCWEFSRNVEHIFSSSNESQTDLLTFFRNMVIQMTTKQHESDITKYEIIAKFIEELNVATSPEQFKIAFQLARTVKKMCPELKQSIQELIIHLEKKLYEVAHDRSVIVKDMQFFTVMSKFSSEVCRLLPPPDLLKAYSVWQRESECAQIIANEHTVMERLKKELLAENVPEILNIIKSNNVYNLCISSEEEEEYLNDDCLADTTKEKNYAEGLFLNLDNDASSNFEDGNSRTVTNELGLSTEASSVTHENSNAKRSPVRTKVCSVVLSDVLKSNDPYVKQYLKKQKNCAIPYNILNVKVEPDSDVESSSGKSVKSAKSKSSLKSSRSETSSILRRTRRKRKYICTTCGNSFSTKPDFKRHVCFGF